MQAYLKNYRQSPRKVRLIADMVRGKSVVDAEMTLRFTPKRAASAVRKLILSAAANAEHNDSQKREDLKVAFITVDEGPTMRRWRPKWRGMAHRIRKRTSNITVKLAALETSK